MKYLILILMTLCTASAFAKDRSALVTSTYALYPALMQLLVRGVDFENLTDDRQRILNQIAELSKTAPVPLVLNQTATDFNLNPGEATRWMRTEIGTAGPIEINVSLLNSETLEVDPPLLFKTFFHEYSRKVGPFDQGVTDSLSQWVEERTRRWTRSLSLDDGRKVTVFSVPFTQVDHNVSTTETVQPTFLVLLEDSSQIRDLTPAMLRRFEQRAVMIRSIWAEANKAMFKMITPIVAAMRQAMSPFMQTLQAFQRMVGDNNSAARVANDQTAFEKLLDHKFEELRVLELQNIDTSNLGDRTLVRLKATYTVSRTDKSSFPIEVTGFGFSDNFPVPLTFELVLPKPSAAGPAYDVHTEVTLRPSMDFSQNAKVSGVHRGEGGRIQSLYADFKPARQAATVHLTASYGEGYFMIPAKSISLQANGLMRAGFEIPWKYYGTELALVADSLMLDSDRSVFLDRMIELNDDAVSPASLKPELPLIEKTLGLWGNKSGASVFMTDFKFEEPLMMIDNLNSEHASIDSSGLKLDFELSEDIKVKEVRFHFTRTTAIADVAKEADDKSEATPRIVSARFGQSMQKFATAGSMKSKKDTHEILTAGPSQIFKSEGLNGTFKYRAVLNAEFIPLREFATPTEAYYPPIISPWMVEIITAQGHTYRHYFGTVDLGCEKKLLSSGQGL